MFAKKWLPKIKKNECAVNTLQQLLARHGRYKNAVGTSSERCEDVVYTLYITGKVRVFRGDPTAR